jgi:hypothetical protein
MFLEKKPTISHTPYELLGSYSGNWSDSKSPPLASALTMPRRKIKMHSY